MLAIVIKTAILSIIFIYLVHRIIQFLTDSVTVHKTKDLVSIIEKKYDEIHKTLKHAPRISPDIVTTADSNTLDIPYTTNLLDLPTTRDSIPISNILPSTHDPTMDDMKSELQLFIKQSQI